MYFLAILSMCWAGALFGNLDDRAANLEVAIGIVGIDDGHRDMGIAPDVFIFLASARRIGNDVVSHRSHTRRE